MEIKEAKQVLNESGYILMEATYKQLIDNVINVAGGKDKLADMIEDYCAISSPEDAKEFADKYTPEAHRAIYPLTQKMPCIRELKRLGIEDINAINKTNRVYKEYLEKFYKNDVETKYKIIDIFLDFTKSLQDKYNAYDKIFIKAGAEKRNLNYTPITVGSVVENGADGSNKNVIDTMNYPCARALKNAGVEIPAWVYITEKDFYDYFQDFPEKQKIYSKYTITPHYSSFVVDNGEDTFYFEYRGDGDMGSISNDTALELCVGSKLFKEYIDWRMKHQNTWNVEVDVLLKLIKEFLDYPDTLTDEELIEYKTRIKKNAAYEEDISNYYATARYTGD